MIHSIKDPTEFLSHFTSTAGGKVYSMEYGRVTRYTWNNFPLYITYDLETHCVNVEGTYSVREQKNNQK